MRRIFIIALSLILSLQTIGLAASIDELGRTVVFLRQRSQAIEMKAGKRVELWYKDPKTKKLEPKLNTQSGTALIVRYHGFDYLVTAKHVAKSLSLKAEIVMNLPDGKKMSITFEWLQKQKAIQGMQWFHHPEADMSVHPLIFPRKSDQAYITKALFPKQDKDIPLLTSAYILGFPMGLGVQDKLSPLAKETQIASRITSIDNPNVSPELRFLLLDEALAQGYSGAPVFYIEDLPSGVIIAGQRMKGGEKLHFAGIVSATLSDKTGGKITLVVPISYIWDILESDEFRKYEKTLPAQKK